MRIAQGAIANFIFVSTTAFFLAAAWSATASITPTPGLVDPRIQTVRYDAQQVVILSVAAGYALAIEFAPDERIDSVALGNSAAWQVMPNKAADHLFVKPAPGAPDTNMTVITGSRTYVFELKTAYLADGLSPYTIKFLYPTGSALSETRAEGTADYTFVGSRMLTPKEMSDDGHDTSIVWPEGTTLPAIYALDTKGREALVNGSVRDGVFVVDRIAPRFVFRLGGEELRATRRIRKPLP